MKRLVSLISSTILLFSCSNNNLNLIDNNQIISSKSIEVKHDKKLSDFINFIQKNIFNSYDKNKDGFITSEELNNNILMEELDVDRNGKVTRKEAFLGSSQLFNSLNKEAVREIVSFVFNDIDKNKNKKVDRTEYLEYLLTDDTSKEKTIYLKTLFTKNDLNKDDLLTFIEFEDVIYQLWKKDMKIFVNEDGTLIVVLPGFKTSVKY
jgi:Ca2+-binding EF-hand superfamily protein